MRSAASGQPPWRNLPAATKIARVTSDLPRPERPLLTSVVRMSWSFVRQTAGSGWRLVQRQAPPALTAGPLGLAVSGARVAPMLRSAGQEVVTAPDALAVAYPHATGRLLFLLPDSTEDERVWQRGTQERGGTYASRLHALLDWTPVHLHAAAPAREDDGTAALAALLQGVVDNWPVPVERVAVIAHGDGGLALRAAAGVASWTTRPWQELVSDVVLLGTPHLLAHGVIGTTGIGRHLDEELAGIVTEAQVAADVEPIPGASYTVITREARLERSLVGAVLGNLLWWRDRSRWRRPTAQHLFPSADVVHVKDATLPLTNHPEVERALLDWLA